MISSASPTQNGLAAGAADIVVATNVLHATTSIAGTLERLGRALAPGGLLVINEVTARQTFGTLVFGLTEGWWRGAAEADRIPGSPLVDRATWQRLLSEADFEIVGSHAIGLGDLEAQSVIVARRRGQGVAKTASQPAGTAAPLPAEALLPHLRALFSDVLKVDPAELRQDETFERYGLESLSAVEIRDRLERDVPGLPATLLFEHNTLGRLARHLVEAHPGSVARLVGEPAAIAPGPAPAAPVPGPAAAAPQREVSSASLEPIAVIGMAGRYPGGETLEAFWQTLVEGRSAITEVPPERWNVAATFRPEGGGEDAAYTKWAGFVGDIDKFDPLFFRLAPLEAEVMDPQERLFLETAWAAVEDAGYTPERLKASAADETGEAGDVGVFVGVMNGAYQWLAAEAWASGQTGGGASSYWSIANRVSYLLDLTGPSMVVDTACSASLSALHLACEAIRRGDCRAAIVGGVNLIIHPRQLVNLSQAGMVSRGDECRVFGEGADGFVDGEGVGAVVLKPLSLAERDGDRIEGLILGTAVNAGGKTGGYTVPSPGAQAGVVRRALRRSGLDAGALDAIEAHGTGTALGDPIEIAGLREALAGRAGEPCMIGTLKSNIGHLESAAGIAALTKMLLQLRHETLAPSRHAATPSPLIDLGGVLELPAKAAPWPAGGAGGRPRRAGISSFGAGGANAHVVIEEAPVRLAPLPMTAQPELVILSARNEELLRAYATRLRDALHRPDVVAAGLAGVARTLRVGRLALDHRVAFVVASLDELRVRLDELAEGRSLRACGRQGVAQPSEATRILSESAEGRAVVEGLLRRRDLGELARLWCEGVSIPWQRLAGDSPAAPVRLPTYPFARERYWLSPAKPVAVPPRVEIDAREAEQASVTRLLARRWREADSVGRGQVGGRGYAGRAGHRQGPSDGARECQRSSDPVVSGGQLTFGRRLGSAPDRHPQGRAGSAEDHRRHGMAGGNIEHARRSGHAAGRAPAAPAGRCQRASGDAGRERPCCRSGGADPIDGARAGRCRSPRPERRGRARGGGSPGPLYARARRARSGGSGPRWAASPAVARGGSGSR